mmetsp:Transcript_26232/g.30469  ORF Transcript_26232/g.30469 Transcript_26232/m.30469 type:complete len:244 (-) Transcript_26232:37-768(-)
MLFTSCSSLHLNVAANAALAFSLSPFCMRRKRVGNPSGSFSLPSPGFDAANVRLFCKAASNSSFLSLACSFSCSSSVMTVSDEDSPPLGTTCTAHGLGNVEYLVGITSHFGSQINRDDFANDLLIKKAQINRNKILIFCRVIIVTTVLCLDNYIYTRLNSISSVFFFRCLIRLFCSRLDLETTKNNKYSNTKSAFNEQPRKMTRKRDLPVNHKHHFEVEKIYFQHVLTTGTIILFAFVYLLMS